MIAPETAAPADLTRNLGEQVQTFGRAKKLRSFRNPFTLFALLVILSLALRLFNLGAPLTGYHEFRQTQTALSVWEIREHGFSLLHPKLPLFGPPWECPFEYPVFQIAAATLDKLAPWENLDVSIRITNLLFYYLTAFVLLLLAKLLFRSGGGALFATGVFLFSPFHLFWSRASMIEYAATFFALAYLLTLLKWTFRPDWKLFLICLLFGILGSLTKITTFAIPLVTTSILVALQIIRWVKGQGSSSKRQLSLAQMTDKFSTGNDIPELGLHHVLLLTSLWIAPVLVGKAYVDFGDRIKERSPYTEWLSSKHPYIQQWNYGSISQRLKLDTWEKVVLPRISNTGLPYLGIAMLLGFGALPFQLRGFDRLFRGNFLIGTSLALAPVLAILVLFNLYRVHNYYFIATAPIFALCSGLGLWITFNFLKKPYLQLLFLLLVAAFWFNELKPELGQISRPLRPDSRVSFLMESSTLIGKDDCVIVLSENGWNPFAPYYLKRRSFMGMFLDRTVNVQALLGGDYFKENGFKWLLIEGNDNRLSSRAEQILSQWEHPRTVKASDNPAYVLYELLE